MSRFFKNSDSQIAFGLKYLLLIVDHCPKPEAAGVIHRHIFRTILTLRQIYFWCYHLKLNHEFSFSDKIGLDLGIWCVLTIPSIELLYSKGIILLLCGICWELEKIIKQEYTVFLKRWIWQNVCLLVCLWKTPGVKSDQVVTDRSMPYFA